MSTTEAKLLALIKGGAAKGAGRKRESRHFRKIYFSLFHRLEEKFSGLSPWQAANRMLVLFLLTLVLSGGWVEFRRGKEADPLFGRNADESFSDEPSPARQSASVSLQELTRRNLFQPLIVEPPAPKVQLILPPAPPPPPRIPLSQRAAFMRLTGIINGDAPQAVIEDRNKQSTRYVVTGDSIDGIHVDKVLPDRIILSYEDEKMELTL